MDHTKKKYRNMKHFLKTSSPGHKPNHSQSMMMEDTKYLELSAQLKEVKNQEAEIIKLLS